MTPAITSTAGSGETLRPCLPTGPRPEPPSALSASAAFGWRALLKIKHVPEQLFDVIAIPVIFTLMFTYLFGGALAGSASRYLQFILPGTLVMAVLLVTMYAGVGLNADASKGVSDRFRSLPIWRLAPIAGALLGDVARNACWNQAPDQLWSSLIASVATAAANERRSRAAWADTGRPSRPDRASWSGAGKVLLRPSWSRPVTGCPSRVAI
jgi:hypothetical protein